MSRVEEDAETLSSSKGLKNLSSSILKLLQEKQTSTYSEIAEDLAEDFLKAGDKYDANLKRRVYDVLNVLVAMGVVRKEKKQLTWLGNPENNTHHNSKPTSTTTNTESDSSNGFDIELDKLIEKVNVKKANLSTLLLQHILINELIRKNKISSTTGGGDDNDEENRINLPFLLVSTPQNTDVQVDLSEDKTSLNLTFGSAFEVHDDIEVLLRMNLLKSVTEDLILTTVPVELRDLLPQELRNLVNDPAQPPTTVGETDTSFDSLEEIKQYDGKKKLKSEREE